MFEATVCSSAPKQPGHNLWTCRFKDFLVNLTPGEWKEQKREEKKQRKHERRRIAVCRPN